MTASPVLRRLLALALLTGAVVLGVGGGMAALGSFMAGQREIAEKRQQLAALRELTEARTAFERLAPRKSGVAMVLPADADAAGLLQTTVNRAAEGQQVIVDGIDALPPDTVTRSAAVHLRATQAGLYAFLKAVEDQAPYVLVPRLEVAPSRSADPDHGKPYVVSADLRLALLVSPAIAARRTTTPASDPVIP